MSKSYPHKKFSKNGGWFFSIKLYDLRKHLGHVYEDTIKKKQMGTGDIFLYKTWTNFRIKVLEPAVKELSEKTDYIISWEKTNKHRRVIDLCFHVAPKKKIIRKAKEKEKKEKNEFQKKQENIYKRLEELLKNTSEEIKKEFDLVLKRKIDYNGKFFTDKSVLTDLSRKQTLDDLQLDLEEYYEKNKLD
jgi:plasmid replication initiation protein